jgi:hypothetical protein
LIRANIEIVHAQRLSSAASERLRY